MEPDSPEATLQSELIHRNFVELVLISDFENQLALFGLHCQALLFPWLWPPPLSLPLPFLVAGGLAILHLEKLNQYG